MKKFMSIALAAMMMASMSGCSGNGNSSGSSSALWLAWGIASAFGLLGTAALRRKEKDGR